jgi:hypothetical protein
VLAQTGTQNFYLAIRKDSLGARWFLSAYTKQWVPGDVQQGLADFTLGTRVISFRAQNDKLFLFDASDQFKASAVEDPTLVLEAWPVVHSSAFDSLPNADRYVLVDPSAGLNQFGVTGDLFADPLLSAWGSVPLDVGLAFLQNFRKLGDGATFEEVFTGVSDWGYGTLSVWGTLGMTLRRYAEGAGFEPAQDPGVPYYFTSDRRLEAIPQMVGAASDRNRSMNRRRFPSANGRVCEGGYGPHRQAVGGARAAVGQARRSRGRARQAVARSA